MKVAVVCPYAFDAHGGVQDQVRRIVLGLRAGGDDAWAVAPGEGGPPGTRSLGSWRSVPGNRSRAPIAIDPRVVRRVAEAVEGADVVHIHEPFMPLVSIGALFVDSVPLVVTFHADPGTFARQAYRFAGPLIRRAAGRIAVATAVSAVAASAVPGIPAIRIIPNGIDLDAYGSDEDGVPGRVVFVGRDDPRKGLDVLLQAWPRVLRDVPGASLRVIGADRPSGPVGVTFLGRLSEEDKCVELAKASVIATPALGGESFGIVVLEGLASGRAVVASDIEAFRAVAGDAAVFAEAGNPVALGRAIAAVLGDSERQRSLGSAARERAGMFSTTIVLRAYRAAYRDAVDGTGRR